MKRLLAFTIATVFVVSIITLVRSPLVSAQAKGKTRPLTTAQMMAGLVKPKFVELKEGLAKDELSEDDWKAFAAHAALLNESSYIMMADERCPDDIWEQGVKILRKSSDEVLAKIAKKDAAGALKAMDNVQLSCKTCHTEHKYKKKAK